MRDKEKANAWRREDYRKNPEKYRAKNHASYLKNREKRKAKQREYNATHREEISKRNREYRESHQEEIKAYQEKYRLEHREERIAYFKKWRIENPEKVKELRSKWWKAHGKEMSQYKKDKNASVWGDAVHKLNYAKRKGRITQRPCEKCGDKNSQAHHCDYNKPLEVMWLCSKHHSEWHQNNTPIYYKEKSNGN